MNDHKTLPILQVYPEYTPDELAEADETVKRYIRLVWRIHARLKQQESKKFDGDAFKR